MVYFARVHRTPLCLAPSHSPPALLLVRFVTTDNFRFIMISCLTISFIPLLIYHLRYSVEYWYLSMCSLFHVHLDRDPRAEFKLKEPKPNVSFFLFTANHCTPPLAVLRDATTIDTELSKFTKLYVQRTVQVDFEKKILYLPEIFRWVVNFFFVNL